MGRVWAIVINTFREAVRDKVLYGVLSFAILLLLFTLALAELSLNQQPRMVLDLGVASISLFSIVIAIFLGSSLLYKEIERKTLYVILPKPIHRWQFLVGKYFGIVVTAVVFIAIMGAIHFWVTAVQAGASLVLLAGLPLAAIGLLAGAMFKARDRTSVLLPWSLLFFAGGVGVASTTDADVVGVVAALVLIVGEVTVVSAVALLFSSFSTPFLTGALTLGVWLVGQSADEMAEVQSRALPDEIESVLHVLSRIVPNFNLFFPGWSVLGPEAQVEGEVLGYIASTMAYGFVYAAILLVLASVIFQRRDFL